MEAGYGSVEEQGRATTPATRPAAEDSRAGLTARRFGAAACVALAYIALSNWSGHRTGGPASTAASLGSSAGAPPLAEESKDGNATNILLIMLDQARTDAFGITGGKAALVDATPNLDRIAEEGVRFANAYSSTPMCTPARQAVMTGKKPWSHGMRGYADNVVPAKYTGDWVSLPHIMADHGYRTCAIGKSHFNYNTTTKLWFNNGFQEQYVHEGGLAMDFVQPDDFVLLDSYDQWFNETYPGMGDPLATAPADQENGWWGSPYVYEEAAHPTAWTGKTAVDWLLQWSADHETDGDMARRERRLDGDVGFQDDDSIESKDTDSATKFFLKLSFLRPHSPYDPPLRLYDTMKSHLNDGNLPTPEYNSEDGWDVRYGHPGSLCNMSNDATYCGDPGDEAVMDSRVAYYGSLAFVDEWVGKVWTALEDTNLLRKTAILFVSDHGDAMGDHHLWRKGYWIENVASIPFYFRWPDTTDNRLPSTSMARNSTSDAVVELRDVLPTLLDMAGITLTSSQDAEVDGESVFKLVQNESGTSESWRPYVGLEFAGCGFNTSENWNALTDGKHKYVYSLYDGSEMLFDLENDAYELTDLSAEAAWSEALSVWRGRLVDQFVEEDRDSTFIDSDTQALVTGSNCYSTKYLQNYPCYPDACSAA